MKLLRNKSKNVAFKLFMETIIKSFWMTRKETLTDGETVTFLERKMIWHRCGFSPNWSILGQRDANKNPNRVFFCLSFGVTWFTDWKKSIWESKDPRIAKIILKRNKMGWVGEGRCVRGQRHQCPAQKQTRVHVDAWFMVEPALHYLEKSVLLHKWCWKNGFFHLGGEKKWNWVPTSHQTRTHKFLD